MPHLSLRNWSAGLACTLGFLALGGSAQAAAPNPLGCRASVLAVRLTSPLPTVEPYAANPAGVPCQTDSAGASSGTVLGSGLNAVLAGPAGAYTQSVTAPDPTSASATASVSGVTVNAGSAGLVAVGPATATASYVCTPSGPVAASSSNLDVLKINGTDVAIPAPGQPMTIQLSGGSYVAVNHQVSTGDSVTEQIADVHVAGLGDVVIGEATASDPGSGACAGSNSGGSGGSGGGDAGACPAGSSLVPSTQFCEIVLASGGMIQVSRPYEGPTGGTVVPLGVARSHYRSGCLYGPGPQYAVIGTNRSDRINGTRRADRILGLGGNDRIAGQGGNDCIDGGTGNDRVFGGNGNDRVYGGNGNDRLSVQNGSSRVWGGSGSDRIFLGNGNDLVWGGSGNDRISVGRGRDKVWGGAGNDAISMGNGNDWTWGGAGNDTIYVGTGRDHLFGQGGNDRLYGPGLTVYLNGGSGHNVGYVNANGMAYARHHGVQRVIRIHTHALR